MLPTGTTQQQQMVTQVQPVMHPLQANPMEKYKNFLCNFGIAEIVLGAIACLLGAVTIIIGSAGRYYIGLTYVGQGVWCGSVLITCGVLGLMTRTRPTRCMYNANMAMSIVTANFMIVLVILSGMAAAFDFYGSGMTAFHSIICLVGFAALIITIIHSAYCCAGVCCLESYPRQVIVVGPNGMMPVQLPSGQTVLYPQPTGYSAPYSAPYSVVPNQAVNAPTAQIPPSNPAMQTTPMMLGGQLVETTSDPVYANTPPAYTVDPQK